MYNWREFEESEIEELKRNPYIKNVTSKGLTYTREFKEIFARRILNGESPSLVLIDLGINPKYLGQGRINSLSFRMKKFAKRLEGFEDTRGTKSGRPTTKNLTSEEKISKLEHRNRVLKQENDFLKKMIYLAKKVQWEKSLRKKNIK